MEQAIVIRYGEIALKGLNRSTFENRLISNIKRALKEYGQMKIWSSQSRIYIEADNDYPFEEAVLKVTKVFGITSASVAIKTPSVFEDIREAAVYTAREIVKKRGCKTFKVETKRGNKSFPMQSPEISCELGGCVLDELPELTVDVNTPDFTIYAEVREFSFIYSEKVEGQCGMPLGTNGRGILLLSGGIDSPVAGYMLAKRGVYIEALHFTTPPYTGERALEKVKELCSKLTEYTGYIKLHVVPITEAMTEIANKVPEEETILHMRRLMMRIAEKLSEKYGFNAIITGESIGQVASQTMEAINVTNPVVHMPVFRPLIGMDKNEVIIYARKIGTFDISTQPFEDCCTVFVAKHPLTKPKIEKIEKTEALYDKDKLVDISLKEHYIVEIR